MKKAAVPSILVVLVLVAVAVIAEAQQPKKVSLIGYLSNSNPATESTRAEALRLALRELGPENGEANRRDNSAGGARPGDQADKVTEIKVTDGARIELISPSIHS